MVKRRYYGRTQNQRLPQRDYIQPSRKSRYLPISEYRRNHYICRKGKESEAKSVFLLQPGARTGKDEGAGQQDCRYPIYRGEYGRRRAIAGKQSYQEIQATLQRTVERRQNISQHLRAERILSTRLQNPEDNPQRLLLLWPLQPYTLHVRITRPHQASVPPAHMPPEPLPGEHTRREVQCLPGVPHQELCRALHRQAKSGRLSKKYR